MFSAGKLESENRKSKIQFSPPVNSWNCWAELSHFWNCVVLFSFLTTIHFCSANDKFEILRRTFSKLTFISSIPNIVWHGLQGLEWPMLWRITKNSLHNEGTYEWVNWAPIFFWYKLLPTTSGPQKFSKIRAVKVDYFDFPGEIFEKLVWIRC